MLWTTHTSVTATKRTTKFGQNSPLMKRWEVILSTSAASGGEPLSLPGRAIRDVCRNALAGFPKTSCQVFFAFPRVCSRDISRANLILTKAGRCTYHCRDSISSLTRRPPHWPSYPQFFPTALIGYAGIDLSASIFTSTLIRQRRYLNSSASSSSGSSSFSSTDGEGPEKEGTTMSDSIDALNLITSEKIHELYAKQNSEDPLVLRKKVRDIGPTLVLR